MVSFSAFTTDVRKDYPLSTFLRHLLEQLGLHRELQQIGELAELDDFAALLPERLSAGRPTSPSVGQPEPGPRIDDTERPTSSDGEHSETITRHRIVLPIHGDERLLMRWPDRDDTGLVPVDADAWEQYYDTLIENRLHNYRFRVAYETWLLSPMTESGERWAMYGYLDLTLEQEQQVHDGILSFRLEVDERVSLARRFVEAIAKQTADFFDVEAPEEFRRLIQDKRRRLTNRAAVTADLGFPASWKAPALQLDDVNVADSLAEPAGIELPPGQADGAVVLTTRPRLAPASFAEVLRTIRIWANSVERYGRSFSDLTEDQISDLLAATLNATLPGAQREVFTHSGKSDIFIEADKLAEGSGPAKIFICESKWAHDDTIVTKALDPQLFGYLITHDTAAVLLLLVPQKNFHQAVGKRLAALRKVEGYIRESEDNSGWPVLEYRRDTLTARVCVATVHLDRTGRTSGDPTVSS
ncbi:hypothetical protein [Nocardia sp. NPDC057272]|uniref:hypothetical protein n=1 Tax=Nocardia sp. NPDC057272 TaxID=3346079 RepID=UPI0036304EBB